MILVLLLVALGSYVGFFIWNRRRLYAVRSQLGIPGPPVSFFTGNMGVFLERNKKFGYDDGYQVMLDYEKTYGKTFGIYFGTQLQIISTDPDFYKEIFIKQFSNFSDRSIPEMFTKNGLQKSLLQMDYNDGWKHVRSCMSHQFSTGKMKQMHEAVKDKIDTFIKILDVKASEGKYFNIYDDYQALTLDVIGKCAFAIESDCQRDRNAVFYKNAIKFIRFVDMKEDAIISMSILFPEFGWLWKILYPITKMAASEIPLLDGLEQVYDLRKSGVLSESVDILKLLLDKNDDINDNSMTKSEVISNCFAFLLAGYETTSTALAYATYLLAKHQDVQNKLYEEIAEIKKSKGLNFDSVHSMAYLDAVFKESLRLYPPVINFTSRKAVRDTEVCGTKIPAGTWVAMPPFSVHHNENWSDHDKFIPERFLDWNDKTSLTWVPFGIGPRNCVGARFAEMEFKMALARVLDRFTIKLSNPKQPLRCHVLGLILRPNDPINVVLERR